MFSPEFREQVRQMLASTLVAVFSQTFDQHLEELYKKGLIDFETALLYARKPADLELKLRGISNAPIGEGEIIIS